MNKNTQAAADFMAVSGDEETIVFLLILFVTAAIMVAMFISWRFVWNRVMIARRKKMVIKRFNDIISADTKGKADLRVVSSDGFGIPTLIRFNGKFEFL